MPVYGGSHNQGRGKLIKWIVSKNPKTIYEFGVGKGEFGIPVRKALPDVVINGCDIFPPTVEYHASRTRNPYDVVTYQPMQDAMRTMKQYDMFLFGDVLEHVEKGMAIRLIMAALNYSRYLAIRIPVGLYTQQGKFGNPFEAHRWSFYPMILEEKSLEWNCEFCLISPLVPHCPSFEDLKYRIEYEENHAWVGGFGLSNPRLEKNSPEKTRIYKENNERVN